MHPIPRALATAFCSSLLLASSILEGRSGAAAIPATWTDSRQVGPFTIQSTFPLGPFDKFFAELPDLQRDLTSTLGVPPAQKPIYVYLFADDAQYRAYIRQHFPKVPYRPALFVLENGTPGVYTFRKPELEVDLRHECTHALLHSSLQAVPLWLDEGIAKYFEVPAAQQEFEHPYFDDLKWKWSVRLGMVRSIDSLEDRQQLSDLDPNDYRYSWAWVHFMLHSTPPARQALVEYLASSQKGPPPSRLSVRLAEAVPNANLQMIQHFKRWQH